MKRPNVLVVGSLNMDLAVSSLRMPRQGETVLGESIHYIPGGKGGNQAVGCARLGAKTVLIGAVGADAFGNRLLEAAAAEGVDISGVDRHEGMATGIAAVLHTPQDNRIIVVPGANNACSAARVGDALPAADVLLVQLEVPPDIVAQAVKQAYDAGVPVILNPAPARALPSELLRAVAYLTPNETEFEALSGRPADGVSEETLRDSLLAWERQWGPRVVLTRGARGCSYVEAGRLVTHPALAVEAVDTTGAGDAFNAALAVALGQGRTLDGAASFAVCAASLSVTRFGAQAGLPRLADVEAALGSRKGEESANSE